MSQITGKNQVEVSAVPPFYSSALKTLNLRCAEVTMSLNDLDPSSLLRAPSRVDAHFSLNLLEEFSGDCKLVFQCRNGGRSAIAASLAQAAGIENVMNLKGGINAWADAGLLVVGDASDVSGPNSDASTVEAANQSQAVFWNGKCSSRTNEAVASN